MSYSDFLSNMDFYRAEYVQFQWDVHLLIQGTLDASTRYLQAEAKAKLAKIEEVMHKSLDDEYYQHLEDQHGVVEARNSSQEQFLRNMALVALASRLTHALRKMARSAQSVSDRKKRYCKKNMSEFGCLWLEYTERFGIDFKANANRIEFVETMREVRNQIVHEGAEANTVKPLDEMDLSSGDAGYLDMSFSEKYPKYVSGSGAGAEVDVSQEQLAEAIKCSIELVGWLAEELRKRELASFGKTRDWGRPPVEANKPIPNWFHFPIQIVAAACLIYWHWHPSTPLSAGQRLSRWGTFEGGRMLTPSTP